MEAILVPENGLNTDLGCLNEYFENNRIATKKFLAGDIAIQDSKTFENNVRNITTRLESCSVGFRNTQDGMGSSAVCQKPSNGSLTQVT